MKSEPSLDKLTIYCINKLVNRNQECRYETIVKECFENFPEKFAMQIDKNWPDGKKIILSIQRCRDRGWIIGNEKLGFKITPLGEREASEVMNLTNIKKIKITKVEIRSLPSGAYEEQTNLVNYMKNSNLFKKFNNREKLDITEEEFRSFLQVTYEAKEEVCKERIKKLISAAKYVGDKELIDFLGFLSKKFEKLIKKRGV